MRRQLDLDRAIEEWLIDGPSRLPDRTIDSIIRQISQTRQRRPGWLPGREQMNRVVFALGGAAAVVVAAVLALAIYSNQPGIGGPPPPTASATPSPTVAVPPTVAVSPSPGPSVSASPTSADGSLAEGPFLLAVDPDLGAITVTIPAPGWYGDPGNAILEKSGEQDFGPEHAAMIGPFVGDIYVPADPCQWSTTMPDTAATTVDEVVAALQGQASRDASDPVDITVDGHAGKSITLHVPDDAVFSECDGGAEEPEPRFCTLTQDDPAECHRYQQFPGQIDELWIVDVNGRLTVIDAMWSDATPAESVAEVRAILASIRFGTP